MLQAFSIQRVDWLKAQLKELGIAAPEQVDQAQREQEASKERFGAVLARLGVLRDAEAGKRLTLQLGWMPQRCAMQSIMIVPNNQLNADWCRIHHVALVSQGPESPPVFVTDDPLTLAALGWVQRRTGISADLALVREVDLQELLQRVDQPHLAATPPPTANPLAAPPPTASVKPPAPAPTVAPSPTTNKPAPSTVAQAKSPSIAVPTPALTAVPPAAPVTPKPAPPQAAPVVPPPKPSVQAPVPAPHTSQPAAAGEDPIIQLVDSLLTEAVRMRASDIHVEPLADKLRVRYRVDGVLHDVSSPPKPLQGSVTSRIKIMAGLNIAEKRHPQDGRLEVVADTRSLDVRVSTLPALHGESIVMRLLNRNQSLVGVRELGLSEAEYVRWEQLIRRPYGMVLVTGPTGSGKTTTLYATLGFLNRPERKLITVEDPVEYQLSGVNQVSVKPTIGLTFAAGLRAMLRQAPDVIMVGEIRDAETAQIAIQAALTGHLVFSTLHTNDSPSAVTRLMDMGIAPFLVASTVQGAMAQRLVRKVCGSCRVMRPPTPEEVAFLGEPAPAEVAEGRGCERCHGSGYFGRVGIYELLVLSDTLRGLVVSKSQASGLKQQAVKEGMRTLRDDGRLKVRDGHTTMAEILKATPESH